ncbi:NADPH-dependent F420 reductase [Microbacterium pumilum]|uniref:NADPH-dependent F420 reductase n=1 Tax=Microbacterium pumilum TaxID=344165 RepID=A0ABN2RRY6_9MICO
MTNFTIIGTGKMGDAIGALFAAGGNGVTHVAHADVGSAPIVGDVVILAVPYPAIDDVVAAYHDQLAGKTVVDISNPLDFSTLDSLVVPDGSSAAAQIQAKLPESKVLKAFNTNLVATLASKQVGGLPATVLIAGDDADAKRTLADAVTAGGLAAIDAGALARAHELEALGFLQLTLAIGEKLAWTGGFNVAN